MHKIKTFTNWVLIFMVIASMSTRIIEINPMVENFEAQGILPNDNGEQNLSKNQFEPPAWKKWTKEEIVQYWAPVWYQDTDSTNPRFDLITNFNYDGDWTGNNNWDNLDRPSLPLNAFIYYSFVETESHWFIGYYDFHPGDWSQGAPWVLEHENDMEGVVMAIRKTRAECGTLLGMVTEAHNHFYPYKAAPGIDKGEWLENAGLQDVHYENVSWFWNDVPFSEHKHPIAYVESMGHGVYGDTSTYLFGDKISDGWHDSGFPGGDGIIYYPTGFSEDPRHSSSGSFVGYELIDIMVLWEKRNVNAYVGDGKMYQNEWAFDGNDGAQNDAANPPWGWDDPDDGQSLMGEIFNHPVKFFRHYFSGVNFDPTPATSDYPYHPYWGIVCQLENLRSSDIELWGNGQISDTFSYQGIGLTWYPISCSNNHRVSYEVTLHASYSGASHVLGTVTTPYFHIKSYDLPLQGEYFQFEVEAICLYGHTQPHEAYSRMFSVVLEECTLSGVTVLSPNDGETFGCDPIEITWAKASDSAGHSPTYYLYYANESFTSPVVASGLLYDWLLIAGPISDSTSYSWDPTTRKTAPGDDYWINVVAKCSQNEDDYFTPDYDLSDTAFTITCEERSKSSPFIQPLLLVISLLFIARMKRRKKKGS
ncbi:MAG: hypothetical protein ACE5OZ_01060 [Candidatus Heimdallarchaeota archaeon]